MKKAFTLAEVLITLTIIGVIAALTIPNLTRKWSDHADVVKVKEAYSILSNAYKMCINENGTLENWDWSVKPPNWMATADRSKLAECMLPYLKVQKFCPLSSDSGCWRSSLSAYKDLSGQTITTAYINVNNYGKIKLQNGMYLTIDAAYVDSNGNGDWNNNAPIRVDINGEKGPNRIGYDVFYFSYMRNGISPGGRILSMKNKLDRAKYCNRTYTHSATFSGSNCSEWIIKHGNMDYKYRDVSAEW